jgi:hypothetical protein
MKCRAAGGEVTTSPHLGACLMSRRSLLVAALAVALVPSLSRAADEPKDVIAKAVKAHGGEEFLKKHLAHSSNEKGKIDLPGVGEVEFTSESAFVWTRAPSRRWAARK